MADMNASYGPSIWSNVGVSHSAAYGPDTKEFPLMTTAWNEERPTHTGL
jgi:hypothetical protein